MLGTVKLNMLPKTLCDVWNTVPLGLIKYEPSKCVVCGWLQYKTRTQYLVNLLFRTNGLSDSNPIEASVRKLAYIFQALRSCGQLWIYPQQI